MRRCRAGPRSGRLGGDEHLDAVVDTAVQEQASGQLGHWADVRVAGHTKAPEGTVPYRHARATAKQAWPCRSGPGTLRLAGLAASSTAVRGPGPMITHRSGVGTTGPFGQTERYLRAWGLTTGLSTKLRSGCGKLSTFPGDGG